MARSGLGGATAALLLLSLAGAAVAQDAPSAAPATERSAEERIIDLVRQGMALDEAGQYAEAVAPLQEAHAVLAQHAAVENRWRLNAAISLAHALNELDREAEAAAVLAAENQALIDAGQDAAPDAPTVAYALAMILYNDSRYAEAGAPAQRACDLYARPEHGADPAKCARLNHVRAAAGITVDGLTDKELAEAQAARDMEAVTTAMARGDDAGAEAAFDRLVAWMEAEDGAESRNALNLRVVRARLWRANGRIEPAREELARLYETAQRSLGPADPDTLETLRYYAEALMQDGEAARGERLLTEAMPEVVAGWGEASVETARMLSARADILSNSGRYDEAVAAYRAAEAAARDLPEVDDRVSPSVSLAATLNLAGRHREAKAVLEPLIAAHGQGEGQGASSLMQARLALAESLLVDGDTAGADVLLSELLTVWTPDVRGTLQARAAALADMAAVRRRQGRLDEGERMAAEASALMAERAPLSLLRIRAQKIHGALLLGLGRYREAGEVLRDTASLEARVLGDGHPETAATLISLAEAQYEQGSLEAAQSSMTRAIDIAEARFGREHVMTAGVYNEAALLEWKVGDYAAAERMIELAVAGNAATLDPQNPQSMLARVNRAAIWAARGRREEAIAEYQALIDLRSKVLGADHPDVASLLHTAALQLEPDNALDMLRRAVEIGQAKLLPGDPDRMLWETGLAWRLTTEGRAVEALPLLRGVGVQAAGRPGGLDIQSVGVTEADRLRDMFRLQVIAAWRVAHPAEGVQ